MCGLEKQEHPEERGYRKSNIHWVGGIWKIQYPLTMEDISRKESEGGTVLTMLYFIKQEDGAECHNDRKVQ